MARLLKAHGTGRLAVSPVSADKAVCLMPVAHVLDGLDGDDVTDDAGSNQFLHLREKWRIAEHVTDNDFPVVFFRRFQELTALSGIGGDGFFHQNVVSSFQSGKRLGDVIAVLGADKYGIGHLGLGQQLLRTGKAALLWNVVRLGGLPKSAGIDIRGCGNLHFVRVKRGKWRIGDSSPASKADDGYGCFHVNSSCIMINCLYEYSWLRWYGGFLVLTRW